MSEMKIKNEIEREMGIEWIFPKLVPFRNVIILKKVEILPQEIEPRLDIEIQTRC